jgi:CII-binding regulator of phage lambda lysogenization HflD
MLKQFLIKRKLNKYKSVVNDLLEVIDEINFQIENNSLEFEEMQSILQARHNLHQTISVILSVLLVHGIHWKLKSPTGEPYVKLDQSEE